MPISHVLVTQADALLNRHRWRLAEAVSCAASVNDLSERIGARRFWSLLAI